MARTSQQTLIAFLAVLLGSSATLAVSQPITATTLGGEQYTGKLTAWQDQKVVLETDNGPVEIAADNLLGIRHTESPDRSTALESYIELTDGTRLPLTEFTSANRRATIVTQANQAPLEFVTDDILVVQFAPRAREHAAFWNELAAGQISGDTLVVQQSNEGTIEHLPGVLGDVSPDQAQFNWDGQDIPVKRSKIIALAYYHGRPREWPAARCRITTSTGAELHVADLQWDSSTQTVHATTLGGAKISVPVNELVEADYSLGKLAYLSDLEPLKAEWAPRIGLPPSAKLIDDYGLPRRDQSYSGSALTLSWPLAGEADHRETRTYSKGLALRSRTVVDYRIPTGMKRLTTIAGLDPATASEGHVSLQLLADDNLLWQGEIDGPSVPVEIDVPLPQARKLRIVVDYGRNLDYGDRLHLVDARMTK